MRSIRPFFSESILTSLQPGIVELTSIPWPNQLTHGHHEPNSRHIRVNKTLLVEQLEITGQLDFLKFPYHQAIMNNWIPLSIGGGIGQSSTLMLLMQKGPPG